MLAGHWGSVRNSIAEAALLSSFCQRTLHRRLPPALVVNDCSTPALLFVLLYVQVPKPHNQSFSFHKVFTNFLDRSGVSSLFDSYSHSPSFLASLLVRSFLCSFACRYLQDDSSQPQKHCQADMSIYKWCSLRCVLRGEKEQRFAWWRGQGAQCDA